MKNIVLIMLFLITSLFNVSNSLANNITSMNGMKNVQETIQMAEPCHFEEMAEMSHDSATPMDCEDCENCQMHCHNLSNNMIFAETKITSLEDTINVFNSKIQNFLKASYPNNLFRPPIV